VPPCFYASNFPCKIKLNQAYSGFQLNLLQFFRMRRGSIVQAFFTAPPS
jgi:hypothetical protein